MTKEMLMRVRNRKHITLLFLLITPIGFFASCKKNPKQKKTFISAVSLIQSQIRHVDSSFYPIIKTITYNSAHTDTVYVPREQFAEEARDFLTIPDLSAKKNAKRFVEEKPFYDELLDKVVIRYTPQKPEKEDVKSIELLIAPGKDTANDVVQSIMITREKMAGDSTIDEKLLWKMNKSFQKVTIIRNAEGKESVIVTKVKWNE
ncbi:MAG: hypothetical protein N2747_06725 [Chitinophagaceae bacterium]|nr:hypothetical protein [Chitinophagaceae bacterium]